MKLSYLGAIGLALVISGCALFGKDGTPAQAELFGCNAYTAAITQANKNFDKLSFTQANIINTAKVGLDAICLGDSPDVSASAKDVSVDAGVKLINSIIVPLLGS